MTETHNTHFNFHTLTQPDRIFWFLYVKLDRPTYWPHRTKYTESDAEDLANEFADHPVSKNLLFGELWKKRIRATLASLEEGVFEHWHSGRIVLVGDAAHKV
jgi:hypothetical protein